MAAALEWLVRVVFALFSIHGVTSSSMCEYLLKTTSKHSQIHASTRVIFVNANKGSDTESCGLKENPCRTISHSVRLAFLSHNISSVMFSISSGTYSETDPVRLDCTRSSVTRFVFYGEGKLNDTETDISIEAVKCSLAFINIHWKLRASPVLLNVLFTNFSLCKCTVEHTSFSIIGLASHVELFKANLSHCWGWLPSLPLLSLGSLHNYPGTVWIGFSLFSYDSQILWMTSLNSAVIFNSHFIYNTMPSAKESILTVDSGNLSVQGSNFEKNKGSVLCLRNDSSTNITHSSFFANSVETGSVLTAERNSVINILESVFEDNNGVSKGPVVSVRGKGDNVMMNDCHFSCNKVNGSIHASPINTLEKNIASCHNCTVNPKCSVFCEGGKYLSSGVLCYICPKGTYSKDTAINITTFRCSKCPPGSYSPSEGQQECLPCDAGYFSSKGGSTVCEQCKNDFFTSDSGQSSCSKMTVGFIVLTSVVSLLIMIPLLVLLYRRYNKGSGKPRFHLVDTTALQNGKTTIQ